MRILPPSSLFFIIAFPILLVSCNHKSSIREKEVVIEGTITGNNPAFLIFEELTPGDIIPLDTLTTDEQGNFLHTIIIESSGFYRLRNQVNDFITLALEPGESIIIDGENSDLRKSYIVEGSQGSQILWKLNNKVNQGIKAADSLREIFRENRLESSFNELRAELEKAYDDIIRDQKDFVLHIIHTYPNSLASILALYQFFEDHLLLNKKEHFQYFKQLSETLCNTYPSNKHVISLKKRVNDYVRNEEIRIRNEENLATGNKAPDINLSTPDGDRISLHSLEGNVVLIDFWASWCPPCRKANNTLSRLYNRYNRHGFEIYSVSLDRTKGQWLSAIREDNINWIQVSDLRYMNSPVTSLYNVNDVPHYILLDRELRIVARDFEISQLEQLLLEELSNLGNGLNHPTLK